MSHPSGWIEKGKRIVRTHHGRELAVWRDGTWRWSLDGVVATKGETTERVACNKAVVAGARGRLPDQRYRNGHAP